MVKILIAEDEIIIGNCLKYDLLDLGFINIDYVNEGKKAVEYVKSNNPDLIFMDITMEYKNAGVDACLEIKKINPDIKIIFVSAYPFSIYKKNLENVKYDDYLEKPAQVYNIVDSLKKLGLFIG